MNQSERHWNLDCLLPIAGLLLLALHSASAVASSEVGWSVGVTAENSSNPRRVAEGSEAGVVQTVDAAVNVLHETRRLDTLIELTAARTRFPDRVFADETELGAYVELDAYLVPEQITWVVRDRFARVREAELAAITPDSRQNVNAFVTGPDFILPFTAVDSVRTSLRYGRYDFSETPTDNTRWAVTTGVERRVSRRTRVSLNVGTERVDFAEEFDRQVDFDRHSIFVRTEQRLRRAELELDLGYAEVRRDGLDTLSGPLVALRAQRDFGAQTTLGIGLTSLTTDPISGFASSPADPLAASVDRITLTGEVGQLRRAQAFVRSRTGQLQWNGAVGMGRETFDSADREIDRYDGRLGVDWRLTRRLNAFANTAAIESRFRPEARRERLLISTAGLQRQIGRSLVGRISVGSYDQTFDDDRDRIHDRRITIGLRYETQRRLNTGGN